MTKSIYRRIRAIDDRTLASALSNHTHVLQGVTTWIVKHNRWQWVWRIWAAAMTLAVGWLLRLAWLLGMW